MSLGRLHEERSDENNCLSSMMLAEKEVGCGSLVVTYFQPARSITSNPLHTDKYSIDETVNTSTAYSRLEHKKAQKQVYSVGFSSAFNIIKLVPRLFGHNESSGSKTVKT